VPSRRGAAAFDSRAIARGQAGEVEGDIADSRRQTDKSGCALAATRCAAHRRRVTPLVRHITDEELKNLFRFALFRVSFAKANAWIDEINVVLEKKAELLWALPSGRVQMKRMER
jgi:hypothetical protein